MQNNVLLHSNTAQDHLNLDDLVARLRLAPESGHIWLGERRMFMLHSTSFGALRRELIENLGIDVARGLLTRMGHLAGSRDAELAKRMRKGRDISEIFLIGPQLHALEGVVLVEPVMVEIDINKGQFFGEFIWKNSIEDEAHIADYGIGAEPVCWMQIGYACGYTSAFLGSPVLYVETECRAMGQENCRIIGKPLRQWGKDEREDMRFFNAQPFANRKIVSLGTNRKIEDNLSKNSASASTSTSRHEQRKLIGVSTAFNTTCHMINRVAKTTAPVLLLGESGVGKEMFGRALHENSSRSTTSFVAVNCAAIPEQLIEADLFGVEKGAFTGATHSREGRFERANGGTLLLDEIGCLSLAAQGKLLRVLQEGELERVGDTKTRHVDVRIIAATNEDLQTAVRHGNFREDLFYRLNVFPITIPPLRERKDDIPFLADYFLERYSRLHDRQIVGFSEQTIDTLLAYEWPGNVRELENCIERAVILASEGGVIELAHLPASISVRTPQQNPSSDQKQSEGLLVSHAKKNSNEVLHSQADTTTSSLIHAQTKMIMDAIQNHRGNLSTAAKTLGITRAQLAYRVRKLGLSHICRSRS